MSYVGIERETGINESTIRRWVKRDPEWMLLVRGQGVLQVGPVKLQVDHNAPTFDDVGDESLAWVAPSLPASESAPDQRVLGSIAVENAEQLKVVLVPADRVQKVRDELAAGRIPYLPDAPTFPLRGDALPALTDPADVSLLCALASDDQAEAFRAFLSVWRFRAQETKDIRTLGDELWEAQDIFIEQMCANPHVYLLKARKLGQSTIAVAYAAFALRVRDTNARVHLFSRAERAALELLAAFKFGLDNLPTWLRLPMERETQREIVYSAGIHDMRHVISYPTSDATAVEATATHSHIDEWADMPRPDVVYQSLEPTFSAPGCTSLICTTGSGPANPSAAYFKDCLNGEGLHLPLFIPATARPGRDETWLAQKRRQMRVNAFRTEYALSWMDAIAGTAEYEFESEDIDRCTQYCRYRSDGHRLAVPFGQPLEKHRYITAVDVGVKDATVILTLDVTTDVFEVANLERYVGLSYPLIQAHIMEAHRKFNGPTVIESNAMGLAVIQNLNLPEHEVIPFNTNQTSKARIIEGLAARIANNELQYDPHLCEQLDTELRGYVFPDDNIVQDCCMALMIACDQAHQTYSKQGRILGVIMV